MSPREELDRLIGWTCLVLTVLTLMALLPKMLDDGVGHHGTMRGGPDEGQWILEGR